MNNFRRSVLGALITTGSYHDTISRILSLVDERVPSYVCFANVHMVVEACGDADFRRIVNDAAIVAPDGKPISVFLRLMDGLIQDRVCGMDVFPDLLAGAQAQGRSVYFYGSTPEVLLKITKRARQQFPSLKIAGSLAPPFRDLTQTEKRDVIERIRATAPDLIFVSLGCPKQEKWMAENVDKIGGCMLGLGQAFKVYAGEEKRLPKMMRDLSLEWAYRLYLEPGRLWKRYLYTNSLFLLLSLRELVVRGLGVVRLNKRHHSAVH